jgi:hypothetical protein
MATVILPVKHMLLLSHFQQQLSVWTSFRKKNTNIKLHKNVSRGSKHFP